MSRRQKGRKHRSVNRTPRPVGPARTALPPAPPEPAGPVFHNTARSGGLGLPAARTWQEVRTAGPGGATVTELAGAAGYQAATILKHLKGMTRFGLVEQRGERWFSTGKSQWTAAREHGLPARAASREPAATPPPAEPSAASAAARAAGPPVRVAVPGPGGEPVPAPAPPVEAPTEAWPDSPTGLPRQSAGARTDTPAPARV
ncbi:hypothetical protein ACN20G_26065 [Streptomyces sp. BI20]|uniref:hypothetical protein n=1 Tax=Streptomyces sp. BI20 TaxID=3403460 RepID=UPI003C792A7D